MAVEAKCFIAVRDFKLYGLIWIHAFLAFKAVSRTARYYTLNTFGPILLRLWIKRNEFEVSVAFMADEALRVEALPCRAEDTSSNRKRAMCT